MHTHTHTGLHYSVPKDARSTIREGIIEKIFKTLYSVGPQGFAERDVKELVGDAVPERMITQIMVALTPMLHR
jgi:hypothetical protein